jgi:hypothetical protein
VYNDLNGIYDLVNCCSVNSLLNVSLLFKIKLVEMFSLRDSLTRVWFLFLFNWIDMKFVIGPDQDCIF